MMRSLFRSTLNPIEVKDVRDFPSPLDEPLPSRGVVLRVIRSNLEDVVDGALRRSVESSPPDSAAPENRATLSVTNDARAVEKIDSGMNRWVPVGNCVVGVVVKIGESVERLRVGEHVVGSISAHSWLRRRLGSEDAPASTSGGLSSFVLVEEHEAVRVGSEVEPDLLAAAMPTLVKAYTALHYQARLIAGDTILVTAPDTLLGSVLVQLASLWGAKVLLIVHTSDARIRAEQLTNVRGTPRVIIDVTADGRRRKTVGAVDQTMEETAGVGVDCVLDVGRRYPVDVCVDDGCKDGLNRIRPATFSLNHREVIGCLGTGGRWITDHSSLQLDPPDSEALYLKGASVSFLFDHWLASAAQVGRFHHIVNDAVSLLSSGQIRVDVESLSSWEDVKCILGKPDGNSSSKTYAFGPV